MPNGRWPDARRDVTGRPNEMIQTFDRYRRGNKQTVEVRHVHIHPGGQGVVGIINSTRRSRRGWPRMRHDPMRQADIERRLSNLAKTATWAGSGLRLRPEAIEP
jgi:hypothetical protein